MSAAPTADGSSTILPLSRKAASPEPAAMPTANSARCTLTTISAPCSVCVISEGASDMAIEPKSQNRLVTIANRRNSG